MKNNASPTAVRYYPVTSKGAPTGPIRAAGTGPVALYIHIPFCEKRCHFCEFAVVTGRQVNDLLVEDYLKSLRREIRGFLATCDTLPRVELMQFGGGTPTALTALDLRDLLDFIFDHFDCSHLREVIVEGFPGTITDDRIAVLERVPNTKLNIGVQSFHPECLEAVGRDHGIRAREAIETAVASRIGSVGVDIIFGLPMSTSATVRSDLETAAQCGADHFALYPLWVYDQTTLKTRVRNGKLSLPGRAAQHDQLIDGSDALSSLGFSRYTAFHYALRPDTRHQYGLWQMQSRNWIGFGMSAMSHLDGQIQFNDRNIRSYIDRVERGESASVEQFRMTTQERMRFEFLYRLRMKTCSTDEIRDRFGMTIDEAFGHKLDVLEDLGLLRREQDAIALSLRGTLFLGVIEDYINGESEAGAVYACAASVEA